MRSTTLVLATAFAGAACGGAPEGPAAPPASFDGRTMVDVAAEVGITRENVCGSFENRYILESLGSGAGWLDFDLDGALDLYVVNGSRLEPGVHGTNQLYRNEEGGRRFQEVGEELGVACERWGIGCAVGDVDGDGRPDLYVTNFGENRLYRNGVGGFVDLAPGTSVAEPRMSTGAAFGDYDLDGDLDLYVANYVAFDPANPPNGGRPCHWHAQEVYCGPDGLTPQGDGFFVNDGSGAFEDATRESGLDAPPAFGLGVVFGDFDLDGDADVYVANDSTPNFLFRNEGDRGFVDQAVVLGAGHSEDGEEQAGMGVDLADFDGDGDQDFFVTNFSDDYNTLYRNEGGRFFKDVSAFAGLIHTTVYSLGWGTHLADFDNDGRLDIFVANGHVYPQADDAQANTSYRQTNQLFQNLGEGRFEDLSPRLGTGFAVAESSRGSALADYDGDGDLDVFVVNEGAAPTLLRNEGRGAENGWLRVRLRGTESNRFGIGALVRLWTSRGVRLRELRRCGGYASSQEPVAHFGLAPGERLEGLEVRWPGGRTEAVGGLEAGSEVRVVEGTGKAEPVDRAGG